MKKPVYTPKTYDVDLMKTKIKEISINGKH